MRLKEIGWERVNWIPLARDRRKWRSRVTVKTWVSIN